MIPYGRQWITQQDIDAVVDVLQSDFITLGPKIPEFEDSISSYCGVKHALVVNSATSALHLACLALDVGPGDEVWTSPITFVASANCAIYTGAKVDFVDIDPNTYNLCADSLAEKLASRKKSHASLPKVVIPVHMCGQSCDMAAIKALGEEYGFSIIEDASHAIGGNYHNQKIGNCRYSDITVFSFHPVKIVTTAEGGAATTQCPALAEKMRLLRSHGITRDPACMTRAVDGPWYYQQIELGFNYRMTALQAALGCSQMERVDEMVSKRHKIAQRYDKKFADLPLQIPHRDNLNYSAFHLYIVQLDESLTPDRTAIFDLLREGGVGVNIHYIPVHTQPFYQRMGFAIGDYPKAEEYYARALTLPMFPTMSRRQQNQVIDVMTSALL